MQDSFLTQPPLRASADVNPCRVVARTGNYTGAQAANSAAEPIGISAEFSRKAPIPGASTLHAISADDDPITFHGQGQKAHALVGATISGWGRVMAKSDGTGS